VTCITWDGKVLAGDRYSTFGETKGYARKVHRIRCARTKELFLVGTSGQAQDSEAFIEWLRDGNEKPKLTDFGALVIDQRLHVWSIEEKLIWMDITMPHFAIGNGRQYAIGAMAMGARAARAVRVAADHCVNIGGGVDTVRFLRHELIRGPKKRPA